DEIREVEARLGRTLPPSLREWVAFAHDGCSSPDCYGGLRDMYLMRDRFHCYPNAFWLLNEEWNRDWVVLRTDFALPDPPVHGYLSDSHRGYEDVTVGAFEVPIADSVTAFVLDYVMSNTDGAGGAFRGYLIEPANLMLDLRDAFAVRCQFGE